VIYLLPCSSGKDSSDLLFSSSIENLTFQKELNDYRKEFIKLLNNCNSHKRYARKLGYIDIPKQNINFNKTKSANELYSKGKLYKAAKSLTWTSCQKNRIYILSALFGIINANDKIPYYDLAMKDQIDGESNAPQKFWEGKLDKIISNLKIKEPEIYDLLGNDYRDVFNSESKVLLIIPEFNFGINDRSSTSIKRGDWLLNSLNLKK